MLEFNELTPSLMDRFIAAGHLPNFERLRAESHVYVTDAEEDGDNLQPWVQWVSVHTGLSASAYGITRLSDGHKLREKAIWDLISEAGYRVWVCGSMNARYDRPLNGCLLPDAWSTGLRAFPDGEFDSYDAFVRRAVQEHTSESQGLSKEMALSFLWYMAGHGLSPSTIRMILSQLWTERRTNRFKWRRAAIADQLQWDIFRHYYRKIRPHFSTFFINSTAHFQHSHWREMEPEAFHVLPDSEHLAEFKDAILYGYQQMDRIVGRFLSLAGSETTLIFSTALSQQPYTDAETAGGRHFYRLRSPAVLADRLGLQGTYTYHPVMAEQFVLRFADADAAEAAKRYLDGFRVGSTLAFHGSLEDADLILQSNQTREVSKTATLRDERTGREVPFYDLFYQLDNLQSGRHHPDGMLWVRYPNRSHRSHERKMPVRSIAPTILEMFGLSRPQYMDCDPIAVPSELHPVASSA
ncbi:hypothetical protein P12x_003126 [Tundrisphaera lichenicola]|uniref:hypothetical protein n=1 Tax=Tundrisphaera lichenicola TaxID=2029860 RepID=UPI003EBF16B0